MRYASVVLVDPSLAHLERPFTYSIPDDLAPGVGSIVRGPFRRKRRIGVVVALLDEPDVARALPIAEVLGPGIGADLVELCMWTAERYLATAGEALAAAVPERVAGEEILEIPAPPAPHALSLAWTSAYHGGGALARAIREGEGRFVWRPLAGEDRGSAIASLAATAAAAGRGAIVLLPEVHVAGETAAALEGALGAHLAWLGSDRPARERYREWLALRSGSKRVAAGGRGAVFAPVRDLGLIVVDDEGHHTYKERRAPRFHARTVAAERARRAGAALVLVGAPPSIEARAAAERPGVHLVAPSRADELRRRPPVTVVDLSRTDERHSPSSRTLAFAREEIDVGRRAIVLVHRSGDEGRRIAERALRAVPAARPVRLDARSGAAAVAEAAEKADLIVATPVIAKDLALAGVGLVAIVEADAALAVPEFRAAEETFATWWHVARWVSGEEVRGRIVIESREPRHPAIAALARWDPDLLWRAEAARRRELGYPPFGALVRVDVGSGRGGLAPPDIAAALAVAAPDAQVLGPLERGARHVLLVRHASRDALTAALRPLAAAWRAAGEAVRFDVDPREVLR